MEIKTIFNSLKEQAENQSLGLITTILIEEMAELTQALSKLQRNMKFDESCRTTNEEARRNILEEIADVEIMLQKLEYKLNIKDEQIIEQIKQKVERTEQIKEQKEINNQRVLEEYQKMQDVYKIKDETLRKYKYIKHRIEKVLKELDKETKESISFLPYIAETIKNDGLINKEALMELSEKAHINISYLLYGYDSDMKIERKYLNHYCEFKKKYEQCQRDIYRILRIYATLSMLEREELKRKFPYLPVYTGLIDDNLNKTLGELMNVIKQDGNVQEIYDYITKLNITRHNKLNGKQNKKTK